MGARARSKGPRCRSIDTRSALATQCANRAESCHFTSRVRTCVHHRILTFHLRAPCILQVHIPSHTNQTPKIFSFFCNWRSYALPPRSHWLLVVDNCTTESSSPAKGESAEGGRGSREPRATRVIYERSKRFKNRMRQDFYTMKGASSLDLRANFGDDHTEQLATNRTSRTPRRTN